MRALFLGICMNLDIVTAGNKVGFTVYEKNYCNIRREVVFDYLMFEFYEQCFDFGIPYL